MGENMSGLIQEEQRTPWKTMIFVDFWNYELNMSELSLQQDSKKFLTDWFKYPQAVVAAAQKLACPQGTENYFLQYERCYVMGSFDPTKDHKLKQWADNILPRIPGVESEFLPRQKMTTGPKCTGESHCEVRYCPTCNASMIGYKEKGVDTRIATEMLEAGLQNACDLIILVSADKDFVPVVKKLSSRNVKCINAYFPNRGNELSKYCWSSFNIFNERESFRR